jgi:riboflavin kinase/FMN adenylyltransferase
MRDLIFSSLEEARGRFGPCALAIGNFDGVHIGHQALLAQATQFVRQNGFVSQDAPGQAGFVRQNDLRPAALTFHPHPATIVAPHRVPPLICTLEQRLRYLQLAGAERILVLPFTAETALLSPKEFVRQILLDVLDTRAVFVGENFHFGHKQAGTPATLEALGKEFGFVSQFVKPVVYRGEVVSSSVIRSCLANGNVTRAARLLNRCFSIEGPVVSGHGVGSKQTVPTLNLHPVAGQILPRGVYITETFDAAGTRHWQSITNVGVRPTFGGEELTVETFLLSPFDGARPEHIEVRFRRFVRQERQFPTPDALKTQIMRDVGRAKAYWRRVSKSAKT